MARLVQPAHARYGATERLWPQTTRKMNMQALSDVLVIDFTTLLPGPLATLLLAEAGAEVIKIERPGGEELRHMPPQWAQEGAPFALLNAGKKSFELDLKNSDDRAELTPLLAKADVVVEQFRPGVMERLGLGYEELAKHNPRLVYCSITGYGQTGPLAARAGHDLNYMSEAGILALNPGPPDAPTVPPVLAADIAGGSYPAVMNILLALAERDKTGCGRHLDIAMTDCLFPFAFWALPMGQLEGHWPGPGTDLLSGGSPRYGLYKASDGALVAVAAIEEKFWQRFADAIGLSAEERDDGTDANLVMETVQAKLSTKTSAEWAAIFAEVDCCCNIVSCLAQAVEAPHFRARGVFDYAIERGDGARLGALPLPLDPGLRQGREVARLLPDLGADNGPRKTEA